MKQARSAICVVLGVVWGGLVAAPGTAASAAGSPGDATRVAARTPTLEADWEMNDPAGSTVMKDATGRHPGAIDPGAAASGLTSNGSLLQWAYRCPACSPAAPARVVKVPDSPALDITDASVTWTLEFRFRTTRDFGNIMQKGQAKSVGGQIKVENPKGYTQCVFKGANGTYVHVPSPFPLDDGLWHVFTCVHTSSQVQTWVDGTQVASRNVATGPIDNTLPFVIGGKSNCDQVSVTCDYFTGAVDWVKIARG